MTARKNQAQPVISKVVLFIGPFRRTRLRFEISDELILRRIKSCPSTQSINRFESGRRNQPWSWVAGYSTPQPQAQRSRKGFVHRLLGKIKITEQADQSCQDSPRIHAIKGVEQFAYLLRGALGHDDELSKPGFCERSKFGTVLCARSINPFEDGRWRLRRIRASGCTDLTAMGIESFLVCSLLILLDLRKSEKRKIAVKSTILRHDVRSIARAASAAPGGFVLTCNSDATRLGKGCQLSWHDR